MEKFKLVSSYQPSGDQPEAIKALVEGFSSGLKKQTLLGVTGSGKTFTMANIIQKLGKKTLVLAHNKTLAAQLYAEFKQFFPHNKVEYFVSYYDYYQPEAYVPGSDTYIEKDAAINEEIDKLRHSATQSLIEHDDVIVVSSVSCIYGIGDPSEYSSQKITLQVNQKKNRDDLLRELVKNQYLRNDIEFNRGNFRVRGDLVEIFPANEDSQIIRVEFFDDIIEQIVINDPLTGKQIKKIPYISIYPKSHYVVSVQKQKEALITIKEELRIRLTELKKQNKLVEYQRLEQKTMLDLEMIEEMGFCNGIENYSRHFTGLKPGQAPPTLIDFFNKDFLLIVDESHMTIPQIGAMYRGDQSRKQNLVDYGFRLPSALDNRPLKFNEFEEKLDDVLFVSATPADYEIENSKQITEQIIRPTGLLDPIIEILPADHQVKLVHEEIKKEIAKKNKVIITTLTKKSAEDLTEYFKDKKIRVKYLHSDIDTLERIALINEFKNDGFDVLIGINLLREGIDLPQVSLIGVFDADKEGFLRSERALIQIIGRAARNIEGRAILFANKVTKSIKGAIQETNRRRKIQEKYNAKHKIIPQGIKNNVISSIGIYSEGKAEMKKTNKAQQLNFENIDKKIKELEKTMKQKVKMLKFEEAAILRDEIKQLKELIVFEGLM